MNLHATDAQGRNFATKTALRRAIAAGEKVTLISTGLANYGQHVSLQQAASAKAVIVGPAPHKRIWYATIKSPTPRSQGWKVV